MQRRHFLLAASATAAELGLASRASAQAYASLDQLGLDDIDAKAISHLKSADRIAVPGYRLGIVAQSGIKAMGSSGSVSAETSVRLTGVSLEMMRNIADQAYADFMTQAAATGRPLVPMSEITACKGYSLLKTTAVPFNKRPFADARQVAMVSPHDQPLIFTHFDSPLTDRSPMDLGNWRAINQMSVDLKAVVLLPTVVFDFAELTGSGFKVYSNSASVGVKPGLYMVEQFTNLGAYYAKIALAGPLGRANLKKRIPIGQAGQFVKTAQYDNKAEVAWWNSSVASGNVAPGTIGPSLAYNISAYDYQVEPALFRQVCLDGAQAMNRVYAQALAKYR